MKIKFFPIFATIACLFVACGSSQKDSTGKSLTSEEEKFVKFLHSKVTDELRIESYEVFTQPMPIIFSSEMEKATDWARRNKFDPEKEQHSIEIYSIPKFKEEAKQRLEQRYLRIDTIQSRIVEIYKDLSDNRNSDREFIIALLTSVKDDGYNQKRIKEILISTIPFDEQNYRKSIKSHVVNYDLVQEALAIAHALDGTLLNYEIQEKQNLDSIAHTVSDPILKFILEPVKSE